MTTENSDLIEKIIDEKILLETKNLADLDNKDLENLGLIILNSFYQEKEIYINSIESNIKDEYKGRENDISYNNFKEDFIKKQDKVIIMENHLQGAIQRALTVYKNIKYNKRQQEEIRKCQQIKDLKYDNLKFKTNLIQLSIIFFSTIITFLESVKSIFSLSDNVTITIISVLLSMYIGLVMAISRFFKYDDNKEVLMKLDEKQTFAINRLAYRNELLERYLPITRFTNQDNIVKLIDEFSKDGLDEIISQTYQEYDMNLTFTEKLDYTDNWIELKKKDLIQLKKSNELINKPIQKMNNDEDKNTQVEMTQVETTQKNIDV